MNTKIETGNKGEQIACDYLERNGYRIAARNWRTKFGELDIVAIKRGVAIAIEVKTRNGTNYGAPLEAITVKKRLRLYRLLGAWSAAERPPVSKFRVDGIGVTLQPDGAPLIEHVAGI